MSVFWLIGVTGGSGSGKSTFCKILKSFGHSVIDADKIGHEIDATEEFRAAFGDACINPETGRLHRPYLRDLIVKDSTVLKKTEAIMVPKVTAKIDEIIAGYQAEGRFVAFIDAPLLYETGFDSRCKLVICVIARDETRIQRVMKRDGQTRENTEGLFALQMPQVEKAHKSTFVVVNDDNFAYLILQTGKIMKEIIDRIVDTLVVKVDP